MDEKGLKRFGVSTNNGEEAMQYMNKEFTFHLLNDAGKEKAMKIAEVFDSLLDQLNELCPQGREFAIAKTKLEEACFFAKKAMASYPANHSEVNRKLE
jgi:hypothetical protein